MMSGSDSSVQNFLHFAFNKSINPKSLGALIALYEHKTFCEGVIWNINSFDQWGVELGKTLSQDIFNILTNQNESQDNDQSTNNLITVIRNFQK